MPPQRGTRGTYARYICTNCRNRKIKCILPNDLDVFPSDKPQTETTSCQRCRMKGLECIVDYTTLGRPSHRAGTSSMRARISPQSSHDGGNTLLYRDRANTSTEIEDRPPEDCIGDFLLSRPEHSTDADQQSRKHVNVQQSEGSLDKFLALVSPQYLLSTLLLRDKEFGTALPLSTRCRTTDITKLLDDDTIKILDRRLAWHRLYYPDIPPLDLLYRQTQTKDEVALFNLASSFLFYLLCSLALDSSKGLLQEWRLLDAELNNLVFTYGQRLLSCQPCHRKTILGLELMESFHPLALSIDRDTAALAVRGRLIPPLVGQLALELKLDTAPTRLVEHEGHFDISMLHDTLQWYRFILRDMNTALRGEGRSTERRQLGGQTAAAVMGCLEHLIDSGVPREAFYLTHSLLCKARQLEDALRIKEDWRNLENLSHVVDGHLDACERHRQQFKGRLQLLKDLRPGEAMSISHLIEMELHRSFVFVSGYATFHSIMAGAEVSRQASSGKDPSREQMLEIADQIIERFAEPTKDFHADDAHTAFLVKYGERRMGDIEKALSDFIACLDTLKLDGIPYKGPTGQITCEILSLVKEIMETEAAQMKGWGGLHERVDVQLLLIRGCASSLESMGSGARGESGVVALSKGCLWAATARLLRSLHGLLEQWKEWNALGQVRVSAPSMTTEPVAADQDSAMTDLEQIAMTDVNDLELLPDDLFFDWNLWLNSRSGWTLI